MAGIKKGQISVEYIIIVGFVVFLVIGTLGVAIFYASGAKESIKFNQLNSFANKIVSSAETVYYAGEPSQVTISAYLPDGIEGIEIQGKDIVFNVSTGSGLTRIAFSSDVAIEGTISITGGIKKIQLLATTDKVVLTQIT